MRIILHAGAQCTDDERLIKTLLRNVDILAKAQVAIPHPKSYRFLLRKTLNKASKNSFNPGAREHLLEVILKDAPAQVDTVILSNPMFFGIPKEILHSGQLYPNAVSLLDQFLQIFSEDDVHLYFSIRNPASFFPAVFEASQLSEFSELLKNSDPLEIQWSEFASRLQQAFPDLSIFMWCNEDSPFIWGQILRQMGQLPTPQNITGDFDILAEIISKEGFNRFKTYISKHPNLTLRQLRIVMGAFAEKFGQTDKIIEELSAPGWDKTLIQDLTEFYEDDVKSLHKIPGVQFIGP